MARILLIHGAAHGAWCWRDTLPALTALGHEVRAIDLPSHGDDPTPAGEVTLEDYGRAIIDTLDGPTVLVGHSMAGYAITQAAEMDPTHIAGLVYLCAYDPWPGLGLAQMRMEADEQPLLPAIRMAEDRLSFTFDPDMSSDLFYHDCPSETVAYALDNICPQSVAASNTPVDLTENSRALPRSYIICAKDRAIPPAFQCVMASRFDPTRVANLPSGHSPFFSMPDALARTIDTLVKA
ncbi:alpha/beta fold hydrolase [Antarctobacter heliothermus]|uniref:Alpha/beta hydrolase family protein n=1 Tax=Antarctobacter heliothermus TaxID=74033 RepID=A0A239IUB1_9RHOB|nr:alpha/beta fold hydrolase [Antarctobacter heliothermus]SNS97366.1 Alpha/beta hydrolase family protein [Antarctobacter heliothermus]